MISDSIYFFAEKVVVIFVGFGLFELLEVRTAAEWLDWH